MGEFGGVGQQVLQNLLQAFGVHADNGRQIAHVHQKTVALPAGQGFRLGRHRVDQGVQIHRRGVQRVTLRGAARVVDQIVNQRQQVVGAAADDAAARRVGAAGGLNHVGIAHDGGQRRAQIMADAGQKIIFGQVGGFGGDQRIAQLAGAVHHRALQLALLAALDFQQDALGAFVVALQLQ